MTPIAQELNATLSNTVAERLLSAYGKRAYFPRGIVAQTAEAKRRASRFNATAGMAFHEGNPLSLPSIRDAVPELSPQELVAYSTTSGEPELRKIWKQHMVAKNPALGDAGTSLPLVTSGLTHGLSLTGELFVNPGDAVIIPDLFWGNYRLIFEVRQDGRIGSFPFFTKAGGLNVDGVRQALRAEESSGKVILVLNFPNNPTGYSPTREEAQQLVSVLADAAERGQDLLVVCDDAYFGLFFEPDTFQESLFGYLAALHENILAVKVDGSTKEDMVWGFRVGFITYASKALSSEHYDALEKKTMGAIRSSISMASKPAQSLLLRAFAKPTYQKEKADAVALIEAKYRKVRSILESTRIPPALQPLPFNSGYFMCFRLTRGNAEDLRQKLLEKGVGTIAISETLLRIAFSTVDPGEMEELFQTVFETAETL